MMIFFICALHLLLTYTRCDMPLVDHKAQLVHLRDFTGKKVVIDFWYTGCKPCARFYREKYFFLEERLRDDENIVFISVSTDKTFNLWTTSLASGHYTSSHVVNLYTGGKRFYHPFVKKHGISRYPTLLIIHPDGHAQKIERLYDRSLDEIMELVQ